MGSRRLRKADRVKEKAIRVRKGTKRPDKIYGSCLTTVEGDFLCLKRDDSLCQKGDLRQPKPKAEGLKEMWAVLIILLILFVTSICRAETDRDFARSLLPIIIQAESSGDPYASDGYSYGLCGISPSVLKDYNDYGNRFFDRGINRAYTLIDLYKPEVNKEICQWYLERIISFWLPEKYNRSKPHIIAAYNWGIRNLKKNNWRVPKSFKNHPNLIYRKAFRGEL